MGENVCGDTSVGVLGYVGGVCLGVNSGTFLCSYISPYLCE